MSEDKSQDPPESEDLPKETIIIVGCVCGTVVIILTIVLVVLCCKRQQNKQQYEKQHGTRMTPVMSSNPSPEPEDGNLPSKPVIAPGVDNPGLDQTDNSPVDPGMPRDRPFVTNASAQPHLPSRQQNNQNPPSYDNFMNEPSGYSNHRNEPSGYGNHRKELPNYDNYRNEPPNYDNHRNEQVSRQRSTASPAEQYHPDTHVNLREDIEPGGDPHKPKKIIYEVVV